ncbi:MAG TPA: alpha/beta hydrolase [Gemmatimonadaceae bacterium]|nr:alpha/beta hydrolase [Gemmatimonadaceae bacterium]
MRSLIGLIGVVVAVFLLFAAFLWWQQERVVFQPPPPPWPTGVEARRVEYRAADGQLLVGYLVQPVDAPADAPTRVLVAFHGNADLAAWQIPWAREVARRTGWTVLCAEYRGYAGLGGVPRYAALRLDARAAYRWVREELEVPAERVALFGHSLGSAVAAELATEVRPAALLLQSPFTSAGAMAARLATPAITVLWPVVGRVRYDTERRVAELDVPVWVVHGARDGVVPLDMGRRVHAAARTKGELLVLPHAGHNDVGGEVYWEWVVRGLR